MNERAKCTEIGEYDDPLVRLNVTFQNEEDLRAALRLYGWSYCSPVDFPLVEGTILVCRYVRIRSDNMDE